MMKKAKDTPENMDISFIIRNDHALGKNFKSSATDLKLDHDKVSTTS